MQKTIIRSIRPTVKEEENTEKEDEFHMTSWTERTFDKLKWELHKKYKLEEWGNGNKNIEGMELFNEEMEENIKRYLNYRMGISKRILKFYANGRKNKLLTVKIKKSEKLKKVAVYDVYEELKAKGYRVGIESLNPKGYDDGDYARRKNIKTYWTMEMTFPEKVVKNNDM